MSKRLTLWPMQHADHQVNTAVLQHLESALEGKMNKFDIKMHSLCHKMEKVDVDTADISIFIKRFPRGKCVEGYTKDSIRSLNRRRQEKENEK